MSIFNDRIALLRALSGASGPVIAGLGLVRVVEACAPVGMAVALGWVVQRIEGATPVGVLGAALPALLVFGVVVLAGHAADALAKPLEFAARSQIDGVHRSHVLRMTTGVDSIAPLEDAEVQKLIRQAGAEPGHGVATPADGALTQLRWLAGLVAVVAACAVVARYQWWLVPLLLIPATSCLYLRTRHYFAAVTALRAAMREELHADVWRNAAASAAEGKDVRVFGFNDWMVERMQRHIATGNTPFWSHISGVARQSWLQFLLVLIALVPAYALVSRAAADGDTPVAVQTALLVSGWTVFLSIGTGAMVYQMVGAADVLRARDELAEAIGRVPETATVPVAAGPPPLVRFEHLRFAYPGTRNRVLDGLDLEIRPGELLAIVGLNGAGKSTLIKLLAGLYEPDEGRITADGTDISARGWDAWRARISVVFQDFVRYQLSAAENIMLGHARTAPDAAAAAAAAEKAGFAAALRQLPQGWETPLARARTGGVDLSGGQWQQVVLTRSLYAVEQGARLLVLDEPTAHLDVRTEFEVFRRLAEQRGDTSVVLISHRLSTVRLADRIVLLESGGITESGTHDELMALGGTYAKLFLLQGERFQETA